GAVSGGAIHAAQGFGGIRVAGDPGWDDAEGDSCREGEQECKAEDDGRRRCVDWHLRGFGEGEIDNHARADKGDADSENASGNGEEHAFGESLLDERRAFGAERGADGRFAPTRGATGKKKIGNVGAGDEQNQRGNPGEEMKTIPSSLLKVLNASAARRQNHVLLGNLLVVAVEGISGNSCKPLTEARGDFGFEGLGSNSRLEATESVQPVGLGNFQDSSLAFKHRLGIEGNPEGGRIAVEAVAEESRRRDADDGDGMALDEERRADDIAI